MGYLPGGIKTKEERAFWDWLKENYPQQYTTLSAGHILLDYQYDPRTGNYDPRYQSVDPYETEIFKWWKAYEAPYTVQGLPRPVDRPDKLGYMQGVAGIFRDYVDRGAWTEERAKAEIGRLNYWLDTYGLSPQIPYYDAAIQQRKREAEELPDFEALYGRKPSYGTVPTPGGGERPVTEAEHRLEIGGVGGAPFLGATKGPLGFGSTRPSKQPGLTSSQLEATIRAKLKPLPFAGGMMEKALEGWASPAMQSFFMSQYPYLFQQMGGEEGRIASQVAYKRRLGAIGALGEKIRNLQWVAGKKAEYLPTPGAIGGMVYPYGAPPAGTSYEASLAATQRRIESLQRQREGLSKRLGKWEDPWSAFLKKYSYLEKFIATPPAERGFYPARFKPFTRWI